MTWDRVIQAITDALDADSDLTAALGGAHVYMAQASRPVRIPSIELIVTDDRLTEVFNLLEIQFDYWAFSPQQAAVIEGSLRNRFHRDRYQTLGGLRMATVFADAFTHEYPKPGVIHRSLRFRFDVVREVSVES